jgi:hypothetical protein
LPDEFGRTVFEIAGTIKLGDDTKVTYAAQKIDRKKLIVVLNSFGGAVDPALEIGRWVHQNSIPTTVFRICSSACTSAWLSGVPFTVGAEDIQIEFHSAHIDGVRSEAGNWRVCNYFRTLGIDDAVIDHMLAGDPHKMTSLWDDPVLRYSIPVRRLNPLYVYTGEGTEVEDDPASSDAEFDVWRKKQAELQRQQLEKFHRPNQAPAPPPSPAVSPPPAKQIEWPTPDIGVEYPPSAPGHKKPR